MASLYALRIPHIHDPNIDTTHLKELFDDLTLK